MKKALYIFLSLLSLPTFAGYECVLKLYDLDQVLSEKTLSIESGQINSGNHGTLYLEKNKNKEQVSLEVNATMSGWDSEEDVTLAVLRRTTKNGVSEDVSISESYTLKSNDESVGWFDAYKLEIKCEVK